MSIRLNFDVQPLFEHLATNMENPASALAYEAFTIFLVQLKEAGMRIESKLLQFSQDKIDFNINLALGDISNIIELASKIYGLYPSLNVTMGPETQKRIEKINDFKKSFEHTSDLIREVASATSAYSVLGDFQWRYRNKSEDRFTAYICKAGNTRHGLFTNMEFSLHPYEVSNRLDRFDGDIGIFGVEFIYNEINNKSLASEPKLPYIQIIIDDIFEAFNRDIKLIYSPYSTIIKSQLGSNAEFELRSMSWPPIISEIKQVD